MNGKIRDFPDLSDLQDHLQGPVFYSIENRLGPQRELFLKKKFIVKYLLVQKPGVISSLINASQDYDEIKVYRFAPGERTSEIVDFITKNFYQNHSKYAGQNKFAAFKKACPEYFRLNPSGKVYRKENSIVGCRHLPNSWSTIKHGIRDKTV